MVVSAGGYREDGAALDLSTRPGQAKLGLSLRGRRRGSRGQIVLSLSLTALNKQKRTLYSTKYIEKTSPSSGLYRVGVVALEDRVEASSF